METLIRPAERTRTTGRPSSLGLPGDVLAHAAARLRVLAWLYAFVYFMAAFFPALLWAEHRGHLFASAATWVPGALAIAMAVAVGAVLGSGRVSPPRAMTLGLVFEVVSSYGIAAGEFVDVSRIDPTQWVGLSWVAVWTLLFTVVIPTPPRRAVAAALASVSAVPVVVSILMTLRPEALGITGAMFFFGLVFPYLLVVVMAYVGARVVYTLGTEVTRARELGSYHLVERLGQGGMGEVWRAKHRLLARPAAIKLIRTKDSTGAPGAVSDDSRRRFEREAQAIASLRSPHTVNLFDFGVADDGTFYYVMELLEGIDTDALVRRTGPVPAARVIHILRQLCHSLSEAQAVGLVHRDIKPANVFLCRYGEDYDFVKVLDFGLVKTTAEPAAADPTLTIDAAVRGTPAFIAPEQALGSSPIDGRADIYATGCLAYWLLTGTLVFTADTAVGLLMHHAHTPPQPPSSRTELPIPAALDALVLECLAKRPDDRPQTAKELAMRLASIPGAGVWTQEDAREWWARHLPVPPIAASEDRTRAVPGL